RLLALSGGEVRSRQFQGLVTVLSAAILLAITGCHAPERTPDPLLVRMTVTGLGRLTIPLVATLQKVVPDHYPARIEVLQKPNTGTFPQMLESGAAELALIQTDLAYVAYTQGLGNSAKPMRKLRALAVLYTTPLHLLATKGSGIRSVMDLRGK